ncbi:MAG: thiol:disulfide interchange protein [Acidimicrobiia bacterium]|nr:MAG: thiol:disulfide interchange protein [Acidimicrobiia bacterium]
MSGARWAAIVVVLASVGLALAFSTRLGDDPNLQPSPLIGRPAPDLVLPRLDGGGSIPLVAPDGTISVVNFWASWCLPCRAEHPVLVAAADSYRDAGVRFLGVVYQDEPEAARAFLDELGWGYDHVVDPGSKAAIAFGVFGVPETYFIDREGVVVGKISGPTNPIVLTQAIDAVRRGEDPGVEKVGEIQSAPDR